MGILPMIFRRLPRTVSIHLQLGLIREIHITLMRKKNQRDQRPSC